MQKKIEYSVYKVMRNSNYILKKENLANFRTAKKYAKKLFKEMKLENNPNNISVVIEEVKYTTDYFNYIRSTKSYGLNSGA